MRFKDDISYFSVTKKHFFGLFHSVDNHLLSRYYMPLLGISICNKYIKKILTATL